LFETRNRSNPSSRPIGPERRWGVGVRHALFPRLLTFGAQLHPSSVAGCQFPDAAPVCMDDCSPFRPRSGAGPRCHHRRRSGETSQPGIRIPAGMLPPDPGRMPLRTVTSAPPPQGRHRSIRPDRWPCATSLASYPSSCISFPSRTTPFSGPPALRILSRPRSHAGLPALSVGSLNPR
jgi:hypothetical protein